MEKERPIIYYIYNKLVNKRSDIMQQDERAAWLERERLWSVTTVGVGVRGAGCSRARTKDMDAGWPLQDIANILLQ